MLEENKDLNNKNNKLLADNEEICNIIQNNIGTRTCTQTRSHAQKFLLKLKSISNEEFNFKNDSIKNLNNNEEKKSIIDILLNLAERCGENNIIGSNKTNNKGNSRKNPGRRG